MRKYMKWETGEDFMKDYRNHLIKKSMTILLMILFPTLYYIFSIKTENYILLIVYTFVYFLLIFVNRYFIQKLIDRDYTYWRVFYKINYKEIKEEL